MRERKINPGDELDIAMTNAVALAAYDGVIVGASPQELIARHRQAMVEMAKAGVSRAGVAAAFGLPSGGTLNGAIMSGMARHKGALADWARAYVAAERNDERVGSRIIHEQLQHIAAKPAHERSVGEVDIVGKTLSRRYPRDHGEGALGTQWRKLEPEVDLDAWWQEQGLEEEQLRALLRDPPEALRVAMLAEADAVYAALVAGGWKPPVTTQGESRPLDNAMKQPQG